MSKVPSLPYILPVLLTTHHQLLARLQDLITRADQAQVVYRNQQTAFAAKMARVDQLKEELEASKRRNNAIKERHADALRAQFRVDFLESRLLETAMSSTRNRPACDPASLERDFERHWNDVVLPILQEPRQSAPE